MTTPGKWISIEDRLPEEKETVIAATDRGYVYIAFLDYDHEWYIFDWGDWLVAKRVTHWMELPPAPGPTMTNGDMMRAMTDEELAEWECERSCALCPMEDDCDGKMNIGYLACYKRWRDWLKQEVEK